MSKRSEKNREVVRRLSTVALLALLALLAAATALTAAFQEVPEDQGAPTPIEQALIEHGCSATRSNSAADTAAYHTCLTERLVVLRTDFGRDLSRLSAQERRAVDLVCSKVRAAEGRDAYVACLAAQLASLSDRRRGAAATSAAAMPSSPVLSPVTPTRSSPGAPPSRSWSRALSIGLAVVTMFTVAAGGFLAANAQRRPVKCRVCGVDLPDRGDLCQACRHEAADALRRASIERAETERAQAEERRREEEERAVRDDSDERRAQEEEAARREHDERENERRQRERQEGEERHRQASLRQEAQASAQVPAREAVFDPYAVLGLTPDAGPEAIRAAYEEARARYDPSHVAHLSDEVQAHFSRKAEAVNRAYQMLSA